MKKITSLNVFKDDLAQYEHLQNLKYADPTSSSDQPFDILLGVADYAKILKSGLIEGTQDEPIAQNTEFGWLISGPDCAKNETRENMGDEISVTTLISNVEIDEKISYNIYKNNTSEKRQKEMQMVVLLYQCHLKITASPNWATKKKLP